MTKPGLLIVFSGPSGAGKDTVLKRFLDENPDCALSVSATTRAPREGEVDGENYFFITRERFGELTAMGEMLEYAYYNGNYYGTPKDMVEEQRARGKNVILEIEVQGALKIKEMGIDAVFIFLMPPSWKTLKQRLANRNTDSPWNVAERLNIAVTEMESAHLYDYIVVNDDLDACTAQMKAVVAAAQCRAEYCRELVEEVLRDAQTIHVSDN